MKRSDAAMARQVGDELVILDISSSRYFGLNEVGAFIWDCLETERSLEDIVDAIIAAYDIDRSEASADAAELTDQLIARGLVEG